MEEREKIIILYFDKNALILTDEERKTKGELTIEKRPGGKFLCFKKENMSAAVSLTKRMYKSLNRFTAGIRLECYRNINVMEMENSNDVDDDVMEEDVYYVKSGRRLSGRNWYDNLPAVIPTKVKEKAPFITQVFKYVSSG